MPGRFIDSPDLVGKPYAEVADYPADKAIAIDGNRAVYKGIRKVYLVNDNGIIIDYYDWDIYGNQWLHTQKQAQRAWGMSWPI
jgi:hypothetical protein